MPNAHYVAHVKPKYDNDPEFRKKHIERVMMWQSSVKNTEEYEQKRREISRRFYENHPEYREKKRLQRIARQCVHVATLPLSTMLPCA